MFNNLETQNPQLKKSEIIKQVSGGSNKLEEIFYELSQMLSEPLIIDGEDARSQTTYEMQIGANSISLIKICFSAKLCGIIEKTTQNEILTFNPNGISITQTIRKKRLLNSIFKAALTAGFNHKNGKPSCPPLFLITSKDPFLPIQFPQPAPSKLYPSGLDELHRIQGLFETKFLKHNGETPLILAKNFRDRVKEALEKRKNVFLDLF